VSFAPLLKGMCLEGNIPSKWELFLASARLWP